MMKKRITAALLSLVMLLSLLPVTAFADEEVPAAEEVAAEEVVGAPHVDVYLAKDAINNWELETLLSNLFDISGYYLQIDGETSLTLNAAKSTTVEDNANHTVERKSILTPIAKYKDYGSFTFHRVAINSNPTMRYYSDRFDTLGKLEEAVFEAIVSDEDESGLTAADVTIEYKAGNTDLSWHNLFSDDTSLGQHLFGTNETEKIRITLSGYEVWSGDLTLQDDRTPTAITKVDYTIAEELIGRVTGGDKVIPVVYGKTLAEQIYSRLTVMTVVEEGAEGTSVPVEVTAENIGVTPSMPDANLLKAQTVKVKYLGSDEYSPSPEIEVSVYVLPASASLNVASKIVSYTGDQYDVSSLVTATPDDLNYFTAVVGIDKDAAGFISIDFPESVKELMKVKLPSQVVELIPALGDGTIVDIYEVLQTAIGDGIELKSLPEVINDISDLLNTKLAEQNVITDMIDNLPLMPEAWKTGLKERLQPIFEKGLEAAGLSPDITLGGLMGFKMDALNFAVDLMNKLPTIDLNMTVTLGKGPKDVGVYWVSAISADPNRQISYGLGQLTILPKTEGVELKWNYDLPEDNTFTISKAEAFKADNKFGATLYEGDDKADDQSNVRVVYSDWNLGSLLPDLLNTEPDISTGVHYETAFVRIGNTWTKSISRVYVVKPDTTTITVTDAENGVVTVDYDGEPQDVEATLTDGDPSKLSYRYVSTDLGRSYDSKNAPTDAGSYYVVITYPTSTTMIGDTAYVRLVINKADTTLSDLTLKGWTYGDAANEPTVEVSSTAPAASDVPTTANVTYYYKVAGAKNYTYTKVVPTDAGSYTVAAVVAETRNYKGAFATAGFAIAQKEIDIIGDEKSISTSTTIDADLIKALFGLDEADVVGEDVVSIDFTDATFTVMKGDETVCQNDNIDALCAALNSASSGTYAITLTNAGLTNANYTLGEGATTTATLTVYTPSYSSPATYKITCSEGVTADRKTASKNTTVTLTVDKGYSTPIVKDKNGNVIEVTKKDNGTYTFKMPASAVTVTASGHLVCLRDETCPIDAYADTANDFWWHDGIHYCLENGLMIGFPDGTFQPNGSTTRAQIVTMLWRLAGGPVVNYAMSFTDVPAGQWFTEAVRWAQSVGVVEGYDQTTFAPNASITREQMATIFYNYVSKVAGKGFKGNWMFLLPFEDRENIAERAYEAVCWCNMNNIVTGREGNLFEPKSLATRAEIAMMFQRFCEDLLG